MSKYENYSEVSKSYDNNRTAMGADVIASLMHVYSGKPLQNIHVLDAGCGTGNYSKALIEYGLGKLTLLDGSAGMLNVSRNKLQDAIDKKIVDKVIEAKLPRLPFDDGMFDVVFFCQVLHHLETHPDGKKFPGVEEALREAKRVLRPKGVMILVVTLPEQIREAIWFCQLNSSLCERYSKRFPTLEQYMTMFEKCGFRCKTKLSVLGNDMYENYYDPQGPLKTTWRNIESMFGLATDKEIRDIEDSVRKMNENGKMLQFIKEHDRSSELGVFTLLACTAL